MLRFFWGSRREDSKVCAKRLLTYWQLLRDIHPQFAKPWYRTVDVARGYDLKAFNRTIRSISQLLEEGINHSDIPRLPIPELGFSAHVSSVDKQPGILDMHATIDLHCGCYSDYVKNSLLVAVPKVDRSSESLFSMDGAIALVKATITAWEPDIGQVGWSIELSDAICERSKDIQVGWITYLSPSLISFGCNSPFAVGSD